MDNNTFQTILMLVGLCGGVYAMWKRSGNQVITEVLKAYEIQVKQLKERVETCEGLHRENLNERGKMQGVIQEKDKRIAVLEAIATNKNPEMNDFMMYITRVAKSSETYMKESEKFMQVLPDVLTEIKDFMHKLNQHMITTSSTVTTPV